MKYYDFTYLLSPDLGEKEAKDFSQEIINSLQKEEGVLQKTKDPLKIKLAYPIKKKERVWLSSLSFSLRPEKIQNLKEKFASDINILRFLLFSQKPSKIKPLKKAIKTRRKPSEKKVELKEIEKKLEEILGSVHEGEA